jgi:predicted  nucleic acid-binding Zn-ribbon protein
MLPVVEQLLVIQDRDKKIRALRQELKFAPQQRKELDDKLAAVTKQFEAVKLKSKEIEVERKKLEIEAQAKRDQIAKLQTQKFQTRKNEEFAAFNSEIARFEGDVRTLEDRELELMEQAEKTKLVVAEADAQAKTVKTQVERQIADLNAKIQAVEAQLSEVEADRTRLAASIDEDLFDTYERLFKNKGEAVVALEHEVCTGCHMKVIPQTTANVRARKEVTHCEQCARILYLAEG